MHKLLAVPNHMLRAIATPVPVDTSTATSVTVPVTPAASTEGTRSDASQGAEAVHSNSYLASFFSLCHSCGTFFYSPKHPAAAKAP